MAASEKAFAQADEALGVIWGFMAEIPDLITCPFCHGEGVRTDGSQCSECDGTGQIPVEQVPPDSRIRPSNEQT